MIDGCVGATRENSLERYMEREEMLREIQGCIHPPESNHEFILAGPSISWFQKHPYGLPCRNAATRVMQ